MHTHAILIDLSSLYQWLSNLNRIHKIVSPTHTSSQSSASQGIHAHYAAINVMPEGGPRDEVGTLNILGHPRWGILENFEHKCWPRDQEVWTMLKRQKRTGFWMWGAWIRMFRHLESTGIPRSSNFPVAIKWRNKRNLTNRCFFGSIVYLRHLSTECRLILSADIATDTRPTDRPTLGWYVGRVSVDMLF